MEEVLPPPVWSSENSAVPSDMEALPPHPLRFEGLGEYSTTVRPRAPQRVFSPPVTKPGPRMPAGGGRTTCPEAELRTFHGSKSGSVCGPWLGHKRKQINYQHSRLKNNAGSCWFMDQGGGPWSFKRGSKPGARWTRVDDLL